MTHTRINSAGRIPLRVGIAAACAAISTAAFAQPVTDVEGYHDWSTNGAIVVVTGIVVCICVLLHYEVLNLLSHWLYRLDSRRRRRVLFAIFGVLCVHVAEIWIFGVTYDLLLRIPAFGTAHGPVAGVLDHVYISAMTFTTVGAADSYLSGPIRFLAGTEALTGLVLITWSASFTFLEMERFWRER